MNFCYSLFLTLVLCVPAICQKNADSNSPEYLVKNSGDTLRGAIDLKWRGNGTLKSITCTDNQNVKEKLDRAQVATIWADQSLYVNRILARESDSEVNPIEMDTVFAEVLAQGQLSLIYYEDRRGKKHFFIEEPGKLREELILKVVRSEDGTSFRKVELYKGILKARFPNCTSLFEEIDKTPFQRDKILNVFMKCCECGGQKIAFHRVPHKEKSKVKWGVIAGFAAFSVGAIIWVSDHQGVRYFNN